MFDYDVVGVGLNATDTLILLPHFPAYAGKVAFDEEILSPGGQVASAMVTCAKLGLKQHNAKQKAAQARTADPSVPC